MLSAVSSAWLKSSTGTESNSAMPSMSSEPPNCDDAMFAIVPTSERSGPSMPTSPDQSDCSTPSMLLCA